MIRSILSRSAFVIDYSDAPPEAGGWGATVVTLKIDDISRRQEVAIDSFVLAKRCASAARPC